MNQEQIALSIVGLVFLISLVKVYRRYGASFLATFLLRRGQVKWAMKVRKQIQVDAECANCPAQESAHHRDP